MKIVSSNTLHRFLRNEQGSFALTAALSSLVMLIGVGAAIDVLHMHTKKANIQDLIDNASLSAALALNSQVENPGDPEVAYYKKVGEKTFKFDGRFDLDDIQSLEFEVSNDGTEITGSVMLNHSLFFGGILGGTEKNIFAKSVVAVATPDASSGCIIILEENSQGLLLNSGANIDAPDCEVSVHATGNQAITVNNNVDLDVKKLCVAGSNIINNGGPLSNLETDCEEVMDNPFVGAFPTPDLSCDFNHGNYNNSSVTLNPGVYCGWHNFNNGNAQVLFTPGTYVVRNGGWNVNGGDWEGDGVSFYFADTSKINFNSGVSADITSPTSGDYKGVAIFEPDGLSSTDFNLNDSNGFYISGLVYLPSRNVTFNSGADLTVRDMSFIVNRLTINNGDLVLGATTILSEAEGGSGGSGGTVSTPYLSE